MQMKYTDPNRKSTKILRNWNKKLYEKEHQSENKNDLIYVYLIKKFSLSMKKNVSAIATINTFNR